MNETVTISRKEYDKLKSGYEGLLEERAALLQEQTKFRLELEQLKKLIFGSKSERFIPNESPDQLQLFGQDEDEKKQPAPKTEDISYTRKKGRKGQAKRMAELPAHLRREVEVLEPDFDNTQGEFKKIGVVTTEILEYTPGELFVKRYERIKYAPRPKPATPATPSPTAGNHESGQDDEPKILIADLPPQVIPKGNAGASLLAYLLVGKFVDHLPFYRLRAIFRRSDVEIAPSTIGGWMTQGCQLLEGLYQLLVEQVKMSHYIQADESTIKVLEKEKNKKDKKGKNKKGGTHRGYMWVFHAPVSRLAVFQYDPSRAQDVPSAFFKGVKAVVQADGYDGYNDLERANDKQITLHACMAHARRKFMEAKGNDTETAETALRYFQQLYDIERRARKEKMNHDARQALRRQEAKPVLDSLKAWLETRQQELLPKSKIGQAVAYTLNLWERLIKYTDHGCYEIDNNLVENTIRPLAVGRKNYLFAGSHDAAQRSAMMYSLFASCKVNNIDPYRWLKEVLSLLPTCKVNQLHELLPSHHRFEKFKIAVQEKKG